MDEAVIQYYKRLLKTGFDYAGSLDNPSILLDYDNTKGALCGKTGNSLKLYINIHDGSIDEIKYLCTCDPTVNVVIETLCTLVEGKSVTEAKNLTEGVFSQTVGSRGDEFLKKSRLAIQFLKQEITKYEREVK